MFLYESLEILQDQAHKIIRNISDGNGKRKRMPPQHSANIAEVVGYITIACEYMNLADREFDNIGSESIGAYPVKNPFDASTKTDNKTIDAKIATASIAHVRITCDFLGDAIFLLQRAVTIVTAKDSVKFLQAQAKPLARLIDDIKQLQSQCKEFAKEEWGGEVK